MRKKQAKKRPLLPDPVYNDQLVTRFVNNLMKDGKKSIAFKIFYNAIEIVADKKQDEEKTAIEIWKDALSNVMPHVEVRSRRVGGATYQVPVEVRPDRRKALAIRWIISSARSRGEDTMGDRLSSELIDASNNKGNSVKKREDTHKMAEANRAFAHYRW